LVGQLQQQFAEPTREDFEKIQTALGKFEKALPHKFADDLRACLKILFQMNTKIFFVSDCRWDGDPPRDGFYFQIHPRRRRQVAVARGSRIEGLAA